VAEVCADEAQMLALSITRFLAAGCMTQDVACWDAGCQCAEVDLPPSSGGDRSEDQAAFRMVIASMLARASAGVR